jgi:hypothetical protein
MTNHNKKRKRSDLHNNTSLNIFCYKNTEEDLNNIEDEFNKVLLEKAQQNTIEFEKKNVLNTILLDKNEFEKKYNIKLNPEF